MPDPNVVDAPNGNEPTESEAAAAKAAAGAPEPIIKPDAEPAPAAAADGDKSPAEGDKAPAEPAPGAPEKYEAFKVEGGELNEAAHTAVSELARKFNLPQPQAQEIANAYFGFNQKQIEEGAAAEKIRLEKYAADQVTSLKKDWGDDYDKNVLIANKAMNRYADEAEMAHIVETGYAHDAVVVKIFHRLGLKISEDGFEDNQPAGGAKKSLEDSYAYMNEGKTKPEKQAVT